MKPIRLVMQAFGPYPKREEINFEKLAETGIFLIKGPTGSGKTTIFDAMSIALYGKSTGEDGKGKIGRNDFSAWRCNQAQKETETIVEFTFAANDGIYRFTRKLVPKRVNLDAQYDVSKQDAAGVFMPVREHISADEMSEKAEELIGLTGDQFRQVVLLPQGKFEKFLTASSNEKEDILSRLFNAEQWAGYAQKFYDKAAVRKAQLDEELKSIRNSLDEEKHDLNTLEDLKGYMEGIADSRSKREREHAEFAGEQKEKQLNAEKELSYRFGHLHELEKEQEKLERLASDIKADKLRLTRAQKAEAVREPIDKSEQCFKELQKRTQELEKLQGMSADLEAGAKKAEQAWLDHTASSPVESYKAKITELKLSRNVYEKISELEEKLKRAKAGLAAAAKECKDSENAVEKLKARAADLFAASENASVLAREYRRRYFADIYGVIAAELIGGQPCPVCGSTSHPQPAKLSADTITKDMVEKAEDAAESANDRWKKENEAFEKEKQDLETKKTELTQLEVRKSTAQTAYDAATQNLLPGISNLAELEKQIRSFELLIKKYTDEGKALEQAKQESSEAFTEHRTKIETAKKEAVNAKAGYEASETELQASLQKAGYAEVSVAKADLLPLSEQESLTRSITKYDTMVSENQKKLETQQKDLMDVFEPDATLFETRAKEISEEKKAFAADMARFDQSLERLSKKYRDLEKSYEHYTENNPQAEADLAFAKKLRGDSGVGLQRYVLGIMFNQIIGEANQMLQRVHNGRYQLIRTDDKGKGNKRGLELSVHDARKPEEKGRSVSSLSGGEKFLVSLSLSIGMSAIAQKSGLHIEALFIDEGFGTLDNSSIGDAMDILKAVQKSNGMIGIISHVEVLESTIPKHLEIRKTDAGSTIQMV